MSDDITVENRPTQYFKNGTVKAYESWITHRGLNKTIKVKHRDYDEYSAKFDEAVEHLQNEWYVESENQNVEGFIDFCNNIHIFSYEQEDFRLEYILLKFDDTQFSIPTKEPLSDFLPVPEEPKRDDPKYLFNLKIFQKILYPILLPWIEYRRGKYHKDLVSYQAVLAENAKIKEQNKIKERKYKKLVNEHKSIVENEKIRVEEHNNHISNIFKGYKNREKQKVVDYYDLAMAWRLKYVTILDLINFDFQYDDEDSTLVVDLILPNEEHFPSAKSYKYIKSTKTIKPTEFPPKEFNQLIVTTYYNLCIAVLNDLVQLDIENIIKDIVFNGIYKGIDRRIGNEFTACLMTCKVQPEDFKTINLTNINPRDTFRYFSGKGSPNPENINPVTPIRFINKSKFKLIESNGVLSHLSADMNLAAMDWKDFETLIKELFELEFREQNIEIKNTQHSHDGGIDIVGFNENPFTGGIILLQAKRYTNIVQPEPVRALKGSMEEKNAIRGILATTSDFGASSYEYASQHNITLINGTQLVDMFKKHGYDFHVDLEQAKLINKDK